MAANNWTECPQCGSPNKLREDWELGVVEGYFVLTYSAYCYICKWSYSKKVTEVLNVSSNSKKEGWE